MSSKAICIRETLYSAIRSVSAVSWLFARSPGRDFTRNVKLPFAKLITQILSLKGSSITCELMEHFGCTKSLPFEKRYRLSNDVRLRIWKKNSYYRNFANCKYYCEVQIILSNIFSISS